MTALWPNDSLTFTFYVTFSKSIPNETTFEKEFFWIDVITAIWPIDSLTFTLYMIFSNSIPNWTTFVKEAFWFDV